MSKKRKTEKILNFAYLNLKISSGKLNKIFWKNLQKT